MSIFILIYSNTYGQSDQADIALIVAKENLEKNTISAPKSTNEAGLIKKVLFGSLLFYQNNISKQFSKDCLYEISCSRFSQMALKQYGVFKGVALTADRLSRCNRISASTINPYRINENGKVIDMPEMYIISNEQP